MKNERGQGRTDPRDPRPRNRQLLVCLCKIIRQQIAKFKGLVLPCNNYVQCECFNQITGNSKLEGKKFNKIIYQESKL